MDFLTKIAEAVRSLGLLHSDIEKIRGQIEAATSEYKTNRDKEQPSPVVNAVLHRPQAEIDNEEARATRHETRDTNRLHLEAVAVGVGAIVAFATLGQLILTSRAVHVAAISADAAQRGAKASEMQVQATQASIQSTVDVFRLDQRAWVGPKTINKIVVRAGEPAVVEITVVNSGKTPALNFISHARLLDHVTANPLPPFVYQKRQATVDTLYPSMGMILNPNTGEDRLTDERILRFKSGERTLYVFGKITYSDIFNVQHMSTFCMYVVRTLDSVNSCEFYNTTN